jgi:MFS family permease
MELKYISITQVAMIEMVVLLSGLLLELPTGALADLIGRKKSIGLSFIVGSLAYCLFGYADTFALFLIAGMGFGLSDALLSGALEALIFDTLKQNNKAHWFSEINNQNQLIFNYALVSATVIGGLLYANYPHAPALLTAAAFAVAAVIAKNFIEPDIDSEKFTLRNYIRQTKLGFKELFKNKQTRDISIFYVLVGGLSWPIVLTFKNFALVDLGVSEQHMGYIIAVLSLTSVQLLHVLIRRQIFSKLYITFLLPAGLLSIFLPLAYFYQIPVMISVIFAVFITSSMRWNILGKLSNQCYSSKNRATAISSLSMLISLLYLVSLGVFSLLNQYTTHALRNLFLLFAVASWILLLPIALKLTHKYHHQTFTNYD